MTHNQIDFINAQENKRHNVATEYETGRHNKADESYKFGSLAEESRHNKANESIGMSNVVLGYSNLGELNRHNEAVESTNRSRVEAQNRADLYNAGTQRLKTNQDFVLGSKRNELQSDSNEISAEGNRIKQQEADTNARRQATDVFKTAADVTSKLVPYLLPLIP